jgi:hypothetical protein
MYRKNKESIKISLAVVISIISLLAICSYTIGYTRYLRETDSKVKGIYEDNNIKKVEANEKLKQDNIENSKEIIDASTNESKIGDSTLFKTIEVDLVTTRQSEVEDKVSKHLVGLSFEQLGKYYENYIQNLPVDEVSRGLQTINIVSFSKEQVVVEKIYDASKVGYYIVDKLGEIKVYYNDKRTLYENTGIITSELPKSEKDVLEDGIFVDSTEEVMAILEGYSS